MHSPLRCPEKGCLGFLGVLPGAWVIVRRIVQGEDRYAPDGQGRLHCDQCGTWYVVAPERMAA